METFPRAGAGVGAVCLFAYLILWRYQCSNFIDEETGSEKVPHWLTDSVAETKNAKIRKPTQTVLPERGTHNMPWKFRTGRDPRCLGVQGSFVEKVSHEAGP